MLKALSLAAATLISLIGIGCATPTVMPYKDLQTVPPPQTNGVYLMTTTIQNDYKPSYQPDLIVVHIEKKGAANKADRLNFVMDPIGTQKSQEKEKGNTYYVRMNLEPGDYIIRGFTCNCFSFPFAGACFSPLHSDLKVSNAGHFYLGHVAAKIRERKDNEFKAGSTLPLIDQAALGFSGGTFDISISDNSNNDLAIFKTKFPQLSQVDIQTQILPAFDRAKAQKFWEEN